MSYEYVVPVVFLIILASLVVLSMSWIVKQIDMDVKKLKESK